MEKMILYHIFNTKMGWIGISGRDGRISRLELPKSDRLKAEAAMKEGKTGEFVETRLDFTCEAGQLERYFAGERVKFDFEVDISKASTFERKVWQAAREIDYGEVKTYGWVAEKIGQPGAARAVGQALGRNIIPIIIPCHRVIASDGGIGGFKSGLDWKVILLGMELSVIQEEISISDGIK